MFHLQATRYMYICPTVHRSIQSELCTADANWMQSHSHLSAMLLIKLVMTGNCVSVEDTAVPWLG